MVKFEDLLMLLYVILLGVLATGCAHSTKILSISCFSGEDSMKAKAPVEGQGPLIISGGTAVYYDSEGTLRRVKDAVCGVKAED